MFHMAVMDMLHNLIAYTSDRYRSVIGWFAWSDFVTMACFRSIGFAPWVRQALKRIDKIGTTSVASSFKSSRGILSGLVGLWG